MEVVENLISNNGIIRDESIVHEGILILTDDRWKDWLNLVCYSFSNDFHDGITQRYMFVLSRFVWIFTFWNEADKGVV